MAEAITSSPSVLELINEGKALGHKAGDLNQYVEGRKAELQAEKQLEHERKLELARARADRPGGDQNNLGVLAALRPNLTVYKEGEEIEAYIKKFERFANQYAMGDALKATYFMGRFEGKALAVLNRLGDACSYEDMKEALVKAYGLTTDGTRKRFFDARLDEKETAAQFLVRLEGYLDRWIEKDGTPDTLAGLKDLVIRAQLEMSAPAELAVQFKLSGVKTARDMAVTADAFFEANGYEKRVKGENRKGKDSTPSPNSSQGQANGEKTQGSNGTKTGTQTSKPSLNNGQVTGGQNQRFQPPAGHKPWHQGGRRPQVSAAAYQLPPSHTDATAYPPPAVGTDRPAGGSEAF